MFIHCDSCAVRGDGEACASCLVTALFDASPQVAGLTPVEDRAIEVFTRAGFQVEVLAGPTAAPAPLRLLPQPQPQSQLQSQLQLQPRRRGRGRPRRAA